ncbi:serine endopeptidase [Ramlibacter sp. 2FC]|uniref:serine endopeptidase n=1 Tax=Ramlibacter sp. 2FC TaxID=2502188 RepID=UPI0010F80226|nr:serine endopeptidase [Ramlibacter sp. 2FC]
MSKALRLSETWFRRGLWAVALVFAWFLIGLGGTVVGDLPKVEQRQQLDDFMDPVATPPLREALKAAQRSGRDAQDALEQAQQRLKVAQADNRAARESFNNWLATRQATARAEQDAELIQRTSQLDQLRRAEREALSAVEAQQQIALDARQATAKAQARLAELERSAREGLEGARRAQELRIFLYRLALTLPLLVVAGWLFAKKRNSAYWPFVWGFIYFALFAFFVELVPYLPSYGGYVRYTVGILLTALVGRYAILALQRYLERQKMAEALPDAQRREELSYDVALARLAKGVCPGCERAVDLKDQKNDFCPHCGIGLHDHCGHCQARKSAFSHFCHACGTAARPLPGGR